MPTLSNTDRLIANFANCKANGHTTMDFYVGRYTGNGSAVIAALRRRGYVVKRSSTPCAYTMSEAAPAPAAAPARAAGKLLDPAQARAVYETLSVLGGVSTASGITLSFIGAVNGQSHRITVQETDDDVIRVSCLNHPSEAEHHAGQTAFAVAYRVHDSAALLADALAEPVGPLAAELADIAERPTSKTSAFIQKRAYIDRIHTRRIQAEDDNDTALAAELQQVAERQEAELARLLAVGGSTPAPTHTVRLQKDTISRQWGIYDCADRLVEGGFHGRDYADDACDEWIAGTRND